MVLRLPRLLLSANVVHFIRSSDAFRDWIFLLGLSDLPYADIDAERLRRKRDAHGYVRAFCSMAIDLNLDAPIPAPSFQSTSLTPLNSVRAMRRESEDMENCLDQPCLMAGAILGPEVYCRYDDGDVRATVEIVRKRNGRFFLREALGRGNGIIPYKTRARIRAALQNSDGRIDVE